nr:PREDICTED: coronin-2B-like [Apteryx mantelli mantelli]
MSWRPQYRSSKFRNVYGKVANREHCFDGIPITKNVHDNHFCAVNARFLAIVTESAGGGSFLVIPLEQTGRIEPNYPKVCGHQGNVLDIKWNPFIENIIASCSEDTSVRIWEIPEGGLKRNMTEAVLELYGHSRRVGLVEWHPTTNNILFSAGYDYKLLRMFFRQQDEIRRLKDELSQKDIRIRQLQLELKNLRVMPKHGLDVSACEVFRFYKLVTLKGLIEPISMILLRMFFRQQDEIRRLKDELSQKDIRIRQLQLELKNLHPILMSLKEGYKKTSKIVFKAPAREKKSVVVNGIDLLENVPPRTENEESGPALLVRGFGFTAADPG